jgi:hypothetical protein
MNGEPGKVIDESLEPTLQAALLEKLAWDLFKTIAQKYDKGELKGMPQKKHLVD